jgi:hypothetical protein
VYVSVILPQVKNSVNAPKRAISRPFKKLSTPLKLSLPELPSPFARRGLGRGGKNKKPA